MSFPRYPAYKPSGVEWLGEVPEHWEITKTKHVTGFTTGWTPPTGDDSAYEGENLWANISDLGPRFLEDTAKRISDRAVAASRISPSPTGSLLFSFKLSIGQVSLAGRELYTNEAIATFHGSSRLLIPFAYHAFPLFLVQNATENIYGAKLLNQELIKAATFPLPPRAEQLAIATFLDRETAKIDALIAEQQRLIELLQEKRQAVISHAVTKGLNPDAPMKNSGVEWLGEVPEHWELRKVSQLFDGIGSGTTPKSDTVEYYEDGSIPWVVTGDLNDSYLHACHNRITDKAMAEHATLRLYPAGSVAVAMYGATIGKVSVLGFEATVNQACCVLPSSSNVLSGYLLGFILASRTHLLSLATGGGQPNINQEVIRSLRIPLPSLDEQVKIADHFAIAAAEFDSLLDLSAQQVLLLQERRSALISAAVTGQIDVRGLVPEVDQPMGLQPATTAGNI